MKNLILSLGLFAGMLPAAGAAEALDVEALKRELRELRQRTEELERKLQRLDLAEPSTTPTPSPTELPGRVRGTAEASSLPRPSGSEPAELTKPWTLGDPISLIRTRSAYLNLGLGALVNAGWSTAEEPAEQIQLGGHDPYQRGFSLTSAELVLDGAVDPYFRGFVALDFHLDEENETELEAEEIYMKTTALPGNLQLRAGQYLAAFGRHNTQHAHQWAFVDQPLVINRSLGPDGLRSVGAELSWLAPTPWFTELTFSAMNGNGEQAFLFRNPGEDDGTGVNRFRGRTTIDRSLRGPGDLLFVPRIASSWDLTPEQTLLLGASAAFGPNYTGAETDTQIYGVDLFWKWKPVRAEKGFPFLAWQTEALLTRFDAGADDTVPLGRETLYDYGFYSQLLWGFKPRWVAGLRGDWVDGDRGLDDANDIFRNQRTRVSPNLTWFPTEFSKIRLQYNYDRGQRFGDEHSVWMQFEFQLGAHSPHTF